MTIKLQKYFELEKEQRASTKRQAEIGLIPISDLSDEVRAEQLTLRQRVPVLQAELQSAADEQRAEQNKGLTLDTADTELRALTTRSNLGGVFTAAMDGRPTDGAEAELQAHYKLASNQISD